MTAPWRRPLAPGLLALFLSLGCSASGLRYSGVVADPAVTPEGVAVTGATSEAELGVVSATCEVPDDELEDGVTLGDLACSEEMLRELMREQAAFVGGTHLADVVCEVDDRETSCSGHVLRREGVKAQGVARTAPYDPFAVEVWLRPYPNVPARTQRASRTDMVPRVPVSDRAFGDLTVRCGERCDIVQAEDAVARAAEYVGAAHFGYPECRPPVPHASGSVGACRAWASAHQVDFAPAK